MKKSPAPLKTSPGGNLKTSSSATLRKTFLFAFDYWYTVGEAICLPPNSPKILGIHLCPLHIIGICRGRRLRRPALKRRMLRKTFLFRIRFLVFRRGDSRIARGRTHNIAENHFVRSMLKTSVVGEATCLPPNSPQILRIHLRPQPSSKILLLVQFTKNKHYILPIVEK